MPSGVEHFKMALGPMSARKPSSAPMPSGVEHPQAPGSIVWLDEPSSAPMPSGVEHRWRWYGRHGRSGRVPHRCLRALSTLQRQAECDPPGGRIVIHSCRAARQDIEPTPAEPRRDSGMAVSRAEGGAVLATRWDLATQQGQHWLVSNWRSAGVGPTSWPSSRGWPHVVLVARRRHHEQAVPVYRVSEVFHSRSEGGRAAADV